MAKRKATSSDDTGEDRQDGAPPVAGQEHDIAGSPAQLVPMAYTAADLAELAKDTSIPEAELKALGVLDAVRALRQPAAADAQVAAADETLTLGPPAADPGAPLAEAIAGDAQRASPPASIPYGRFQEVYRDAQEWKRRAESQDGLLRSLAQALAKGGPAAAGPLAPPPPSPDEQIKTLQQQRRDLGKRYDDGSLTSADYEDSKEALNEQLADIRARQRAAPEDRLEDEPGQRDSLALQQATETMVVDNLWLGRLAGESPDTLGALNRLAQERFILMGHPMDGSEQMTLRLRQIAVEIGREHKLHERFAVQSPQAVSPGAAPGAKPNGQPPPIPPGAPGLRSAVTRAGAGIGVSPPPDIGAGPGSGINQPHADLTALDKMSVDQLTRTLSANPALKAQFEQYLNQGG